MQGSNIFCSFKERMIFWDSWVSIKTEFPLKREAAHFPLISIHAFQYFYSVFHVFTVESLQDIQRQTILVKLWQMEAIDVNYKRFYRSD